ncbi:hypothetical protein AXK11_00795 [Cephaloticoccus primus]|uniref:LysM domain-containing protein n=1 Tax=Cephaloticoccus primus TaxID=1548207 RepID=A0A139SUT3_9BACT|nr:N-acetylmuramoyl-L-alanine amidase [Cephaloticoccus primus]KXU38222.1 hypothetical protein AXK11_00795 [Cephaloticoccus primus]
MPYDRRQFLSKSLLGTAGLLLVGSSPPLLGAPAPAKAGEQTYTIKKGDTLSRIASRHGIPLVTLKTRNQLSGDRILVGQKLVIPAKPSAVKAAAANPPATARASVLATSSLAEVIAASAPLRIDRQRWRHIVLHHSGIERGSAKTYDAEHRRRGMENGLAYHFVIGNGRDCPEGQIDIGPRWLKQLRGGHVRDSHVNDTGIGICLVGNFEQRAPSPKQLAATWALIDWLRRGQINPKHTITVHRWVDRNHTVCPGRHFPFAELKRRYKLS